MLFKELFLALIFLVKCKRLQLGAAFMELDLVIFSLDLLLFQQPW